MKHRREGIGSFFGLYLFLFWSLVVVCLVCLPMGYTSLIAHEHYYRPTLENGDLTICRLKKIEKAHQNANGQDAHAWWCLYEGANGSGFLELVDSYRQCPKEVVCEYDPKEKPPSVKDMLNAMKEAFK